MIEQIKPPEAPLTDEDLELADDILDNLLENPRTALKLYMRAKPAVKQMLGNVDPRELLIENNPRIDSEKIIAYSNARDAGDELGMRRVYQECNSETKQEIEELFRKK